MIRDSRGIRTDGTGIRGNVPSIGGNIGGICANGIGIGRYFSRIQAYGIGIGLYGIQNRLFLIKGPAVNTDHKVIAGIPAYNIHIGDIPYGIGKIILKVGFYLHIVQGKHPNGVFFEFVRTYGSVAQFVLPDTVVLYVDPIDTPIHDLFGTDTVRGHLDMVVLPNGGNENGATTGRHRGCGFSGQVGNAPNFLTDIDPFGAIVIMYTSQVGVIDHGPG